MLFWGRLLDSPSIREESSSPFFVAQATNRVTLASIWPSLRERKAGALLPGLAPFIAGDSRQGGGMDFSFPLLEKRDGDREHSNPSSAWHLCQLSNPEASGGRIRLQLTIPYYEIGRELGTGQRVVSVALTWP